MQHQLCFVIILLTARYNNCSQLDNGTPCITAYYNNIQLTTIHDLKFAYFYILILLPWYSTVASQPSQSYWYLQCSEISGQLVDYSIYSRLGELEVLSPSLVLFPSLPLSVKQFLCPSCSILCCQYSQKLGYVLCQWQCAPIRHCWYPYSTLYLFVWQSLFQSLWDTHAM